MQCSWSWRSRRCELKPTSSDGDFAASTTRCRLKLAPTWPTMRCVPSELRPPLPSPAPTPLPSPPEAPQAPMSSVVPFELCISLLVVALFALWRWLSHGLLATCARLLFQRGRKRAGVHTGVVFPTCVADLRGLEGAAYVTKMLRRGRGAGRRLPPDVRVTSVVVRDSHAIDDGVKGDKVVIDVRYSGATDLPTAFFVKFNIDALSPMRLLVEASDVCKCEAYFYHTLQHNVPVRSPEAYFVDYSPSSGEFVLLSEVVQFAARGAEAVAGSVLPLKHRIRDVITKEEQQAFIVAGAKLNAQFWSGRESVLSRETPRFEETHARLWTLIQLTGLTGLHHSTKCTLKGRRVNPAFMTWSPPQELVGRELEIIRDMPAIMRSLCEDESMVAFGHNDLMLDNAYFWRTVGGALEFGLFDWQQACLNNVGQEWAWNFHFLPPDFLTAHEDEFISLILKTYAEHGVELSRQRFVEAYVLGTAQMYVFSGAGLQALLGDLHRHQLYMTLQPDDPRCRLSCVESGLPKALHEKLVGAEMSRRAFTNVCNIMRRHDFTGAWARWREARASRRDSLRRSTQHSVAQTAGVAADEAEQAVAKVDAVAAGLEAAQEKAAKVAAAKVEGAKVEAARLDMDAAKVGVAKAEMASGEAAQAVAAGVVDAAGVNATSLQAANVEVATVDGTKAKAAARVEAAEVEAEQAEAAKEKIARVEPAKVEVAKAEAAKLETMKMEAAKAEAARVEAAKVEMARVEAAKVEEAEAEARRLEAAKVKAAKVEAAKAEVAKLETMKMEAAKMEAARVEAAKVEMERVEAAKIEEAEAEARRVEAAKVKAAKVEAAKAEVAKLETMKMEAAKAEAARVEAAKVEMARVEAAKVEEAEAEVRRVEAAKVKAAKVEAAKAEVAKLETMKMEAAKAEAARVEAAKVEMERVEAAKIEEAEAEARRVEAAKVKAAKLEAAKVEMARVEAAKVEEAKAEAARVEAAKLELARMVAAKMEAARVQEAKAQAAREEAAKVEMTRVEAAKLEEAKAEAERVKAAEVAKARVEATRMKAAKAEAAREEAAKVEMARVEAAKAEEAKAEAARAKAAEVANARVEAARVEAAKVEAAMVEMARAEKTKANAARAEAVKVEMARVEAAKVEEAKVEAARAKAEEVTNARVDASRMEAKAEAARVEMPRVQKAKANAAREEAAKVKAATVEAAKVEAAKVEAAKVEMARVEAAKVEGAKTAAARVNLTTEAKARVEVAKVEGAMVEAARAKAAKVEAVRLEAATVEAATVKLANVEAAKVEAVKETENLEMATEATAKAPFAHHNSEATFQLASRALHDHPDRNVPPVPFLPALSSRTTSFSKDPEEIDAWLQAKQAERVDELKQISQDSLAGNAASKRGMFCYADQDRTSPQGDLIPQVQKSRSSHADQNHTLHVQTVTRAKSMQTNTQQHTAATPTPEAAHSPYNAVDEYF